jgi:transposase, IS5 family
MIMTVKQSGQFSFVDALLPQGIGRNERLDRLSGLVKWYRFEKILAGCVTMAVRDGPPTARF